MAFRYGNRSQISFLPDSIEKYVSEDDVVRVYDTFIDCIDIKELGLKTNERSVGNSSYDPITMLKILVYAYSYGWRSSRKIERALRHNLSFIWLAGGLRPDFKTISEFRRNNLKSLKNILVQSARLAMKLDLIHGNILFVDGSKFRANAGNKQTKSLATWEAYEKHISKRIDELLEEINLLDETEPGGLVVINKELKSKKRLQTKINTLLEEFKDEEKINGTDTDCKIMQSRQGAHAGYNVQATTDEAHGLIVSLEGNNSSNDLNQLTIQVKNAENNLRKTCDTVCADAGYSSIEDQITLIENDKTLVVPTQKQAVKEKKENPFDKDYFNYVENEDIYVCPEGKKLHRTTKKVGAKKIEYRIKNKYDCLNCDNYGKCTISRSGRKVVRSRYESTKEEISEFYESEEGQKIYKKRKMRVELQFGHLKRNLGAGAFLLRGVEAINTELGLLGTSFNLARMITLLGGVRPIISRLTEIK
jgi:transposase